jgi:hypothetical protein
MYPRKGAGSGISTLGAKLGPQSRLFRFRPLPFDRGQRIGVNISRRGAEVTEDGSIATELVTTLRKTDWLYIFASAD